MLGKPEKFEETILLLANILRNYQYAFRGTASLLLQKIEMNVDDIDILCDRKTALVCNELLKDFLLEEVSYKESDKFKSYFGKFKINNIPVEVMGEWQIKDAKENWSIPFNASGRKKITINGKECFVTSVEEELLVSAKMGRWTTYHKILRQFKAQEGKNLPILF